MTTNNSIGIRAAQVIADLPHDAQDLVMEAVRDPNEARRMIGEIARIRAEDAFELGHEAMIEATVRKAAREAVAAVEAGPPKNTRREGPAKPLPKPQKPQKPQPGPTTSPKPD